jgi:hypothetical protein
MRAATFLDGFAQGVEARAGRGSHRRVWLALFTALLLCVKTRFD